MSIKRVDKYDSCFKVTCGQGPTPKVRSSVDPDEMTDEDLEYIRAMDAFRCNTGVRFPTTTQYLGVAKILGYVKVSTIVYESTFDGAVATNVRTYGKAS